MKNAIASLFALTGCGLVVYGLALWSIALACTVAGLLLLLVSFNLSSTRRKAP